MLSKEMTITRILLLAWVSGSFVAAKSIPERTPAANPIRVLFFLSESKLWRLRLDNGLASTNSSPRLASHGPLVDYDVDDVLGRLFWIDRTGQILSRPILDDDGGDEFVLAYQPAASGARISRDQIGDKLYVIDGQSQEVDVLEPRGRNQTVLFERQPVREEHVVREKPRKLVLDPQRGLMFILTDLNGSKNIYRSNMDGTSIKLLVSKTGGDELSLDRLNRRIFWANGELKAIESADYEGNNRKLVVKYQTPVALTVDSNQLFWAAAENNSSSNIKVCKLREGACEEAHLVANLAKLPKPHSLKIALTSETGLSSRQSIPSPCSRDNGGCRQLCLLTSSPQGRSCACAVGWRPAKDDPKDCRRRDDGSNNNKGTSRPKRQLYWDMYTPQYTPRPEPQVPQMPGVPLYMYPSSILFFGK